MFTCDWCQQEYEGRPIVLATMGRRLSGVSEHECVCKTCADLAASEALVVLSMVSVSHMLHDTVARTAA